MNVLKPQDFVRITKLSSLNDDSKNNDSTWVFLPGEFWWCEGYSL